MQQNNELTITGTQVAYYFICHRKLWLFSHQVTMEHSSDLVSLGRQLHEDSYRRQKREIQIGPIKVDFLRSGCQVHEVKKSKKMQSAHEWQMRYYLYYLKQHGISARGFINYPLLRQVKEVELTDAHEAQMERILAEIRSIISREHPPKPVKIPACKKCSYYEFCWS